MIAEMIAVTLHPELQKSAHTSFVSVSRQFISLTIGLPCVYEYMSFPASGRPRIPIKPLRAAWFHLIPIYGCTGFSVAAGTSLGL